MLVMVLGIALTAGAECEGKKKHTDWWENSYIKKEVGITPEQDQQIEGIVKLFEPRIKESRKVLHEQKKAFYESMKNPESSNADVIKAFDVMWDAKYKAKRVGLDMKLAIRDVITTDQRIKLNNVRDNWMYRRNSEMRETLKKVREKSNSADEEGMEEMKESEETQ